MWINYLSLNWWLYRISEPSTVLPFISWFLTSDETPSTMFMGHQAHLSLEGQAPWSHHWLSPLEFSSHKRGEKKPWILRLELANSSNYSANTCIKVLKIGSNLVNLDQIYPHLMPSFVSGSPSRSAVVITKISISKAAVRRGQRSDWIGGCSYRLVGHPKTWYPTRVSGCKWVS